MPTLAESGAQSIEATAWQGVMAPPKTSPAIIERMVHEIAVAMSSDEMKRALDAQGAYSIASSTDGYAAFLKDQM